MLGLAAVCLFATSRKIMALCRGRNPFSALALLLVVVTLLAFIPVCRAGGSDILTLEERQWLTVNQDRLVLAVETGYAPFAFVGEEGQPTGLAHDYLRLVEEKLGVRFHRERFSALEDILQKVRAGQVHIVNAVTKTPARSEYLLFTSHFIVVPNVILVRRDNLESFDEKKLAGRRVALVQSYAVGEYLAARKLGFTADPVADDLTALFNVAFGLSDAAVIDLATASYLIAQKGISNLRVAGETAFAVRLSLAAAKSEPMLQTILEKGLGAISEEEKADIRRRWIDVADPSIFRDWRFKAALGGSLLLLVVGVGVVLVWNHTLRRQVAARTLALAEEKEMVRQREELYRQLIETASDAIYLLDEEGRVVQANSAAAEKLGRSVPEMKTMRFGEVDPHFSLADFLDFWRSVPEGRAVILETTHLRSDGNEYPVEISSKKFTVNGKQYFYGIARDITERKKTEAEREKLQEQLQQAQKMESVGRLAGGVAHDFNNMLGVILGRIELAEDYVDPSQPFYIDLQEMRKAAERSINLTKQLLAFARKQTIDPKILDLNEAVDGMLQMVRRLIGEDIDLIWRPDTRLWPVRIDPSQLDQILANLCINARDAINGVGRLTIETENVVFDAVYCTDHRGYVPGEYVQLAVSDDGCGMDKETLGHLFEPFFTTKERGKGTGLGLAMVYGIVKQNNGFVNVYSESGRGTTFKIYLPRPGDKVEERVGDGALLPLQGGAETILLVEDEPAILAMTTSMLARLGYTVLAAATPGKAMELAQSHSGEIRLLLTDVVMPEMNGRDLAKQIRGLCPGLRTLFMSGYTANVIAHQGVLDSDVQFIEKPFSKKDLAAKLRTVLNADVGTA